MTWIDNNGDVRPQSWEEYCNMVRNAPDWPTTQRLMRRFGIESRRLRSHERSLRRKAEGLPPMRERLFRADPNCFWCGILTVLANNNYNELDLATVDHLYSKFHPDRKSRHSAKTGTLHVLACRGCNQQRALCELRQEVFVPKLADKAEFARLADATHAKRAALTASIEGKFPTPSRMRVIQTLEDAVVFARANPAR